jgi:hypothetical protein
MHRGVNASPNRSLRQFVGILIAALTFSDAAPADDDKLERADASKASMQDRVKAADGESAPRAAE